MADSKITALTAITTVNPATYPLVIVDTSDTSMALSGTTKKVTTNQLLGAGGTATLASATITGDLTVDTSTLKVDSALDRVGVGTASLASYTNANLVIYGAANGIVAIGNSTANTNFQKNGADFFINTNVTGAGSNAGSFIIRHGSSFAEQFRIDSSGNVGIGVTPSAGAGCLQLVSGINFPATQVASANANTLDDYEEGTWTPSVGGTATYLGQTGRYVKIGNRVYITLRMTINVIGTGDDYRILGLPFQPAGTLAAATVGFFANLKITANFISGYASTGGAVITMTGTTAASANITNGIGVFGNSSDIVMSCFYEV